MTPAIANPSRGGALRAGAEARRPSSSALAALVDVRACGAPRMRALAERLAGRAVGVIGSGPEADRAARQGLRVVAAFAPPLGSIAMAGGALRRSLGRVPLDGSLVAVGPRARDAAAALGVRAVAPDDALPAPVAPIARGPLREAWSVREGECACLLLASPAGACDARAALDIVGRTAVAGGPVVLIAHPSSGELLRAQALAAVPDGAWRLVTDERAEEPELLSQAVDAALVVDRRMPEERAGRGGLAVVMAAFARGGASAHLPGDAMGARLASRAGIPIVAAAGTAAADVDGLIPPERVFEPRRPNLGARALQAIRSAASR